MTLVELWRGALKSWPIILAAVIAAMLAAVVIVRTATPQYGAAMSIVKARNESGPASIIGQFTGNLAPDTSVDELIATIHSRQLSEELLSDGQIRRQIEVQLAPPPPTLFDRVRSFVVSTLFGQARPPLVLTERLQEFLDGQLKISNEGSVIRLEVVHADSKFAKQLLAASFRHAERMVLARKRARAIAYRQYLTTLLAQNTNVAVNQATGRLLAAAIEDATRLSGPSAEIFAVVDEPYVGQRPVSPRVGLTAAICLAIGLSIGLGMALLRSRTSPSRAADQLG